MNQKYLLPILLTVVLAGCSDTETPVQSEAPPLPPPTASEALKQKSEEWLDKTRELGEVAKEAAKEQSAELREKTDAALEEAKKRSTELANQAEEAAREWADKAKEKIDEKIEELEQPAQEEQPKQIAL